MKRGGYSRQREWHMQRPSGIREPGEYKEGKKWVWLEREEHGICW